MDVRHHGQPHGRRSIQRLLRTHLVRCEPLDALADPRYFVRHVQRLEAMAGVRITTLRRLRRGRRRLGGVRRDEADAAADPSAPSTTGAPQLSRSNTT